MNTRNTEDSLAVMTITIDSIELKELKDTGTFMDPQDPCVHLTIGAAVYKTKRKEDAGTSALFDDEAIELAITDDDYYGEMKLEVFNEHVTGMKKHVGVGTIKPAAVWGYKNYPATVTIPLTNIKSKKDDKQRGFAIVTGKVVDDRSLFAECACVVS
mmetsp:Transcript_6073/g.9918  ORF Transcript_6073/g.9918 Transcript_6073/m.9918 type:complete len:157 (+) Transcript_6073:137-607(+)